MSHRENQKKQPVIEVKNLGKKYIISHEQKAEYGSLRDSIVSFLKKPFEKRGQNLGLEEKKEEFWALKDVSFEVNKGEIFGVIGRNGSGKSTLLKTLSRIITPTTGEAIIRGTTASLLEVGTGFHPELTGRENIFFNGSMLGMSRDEIGKKFDEIVHFAEIEKFLDTPVKFYSSGMYVRLAFSVAAHLEPDVLILDEVLAVGDARFQKKSMNKILKTMEGGTTVLFVSHSMESIQKLCSRGLLLNKGEVSFIGDVSELTDRYQAFMRDEEKELLNDPVWNNNGSADNEYFIPSEMYITDQENRLVKGVVKNNTSHTLHIKGTILDESQDYTIGYVIRNQNKALLYMSLQSDMPDKTRDTIRGGEISFTTTIPPHYLNAGTYEISLIAGSFNKFWIFDPDMSTPSITFTVLGGLSDSRYWKEARSGLLAPVMDWEVRQ